MDMPERSIDCVFTSPEPIRTYADYLMTMEILGQECKRVLKTTGSMWVNMEDAFDESGTLRRWPAKFSCEMVSTYDWLLRAERIWHLPIGGRNFYNGGKIDNNRLILDHSYVYHFTTNRHDYYNTFESFEGQPCSVFTENPGPRFSLELIKQSLLMSCPTGGTVLDPFCGAIATTGFVALSMNDKKYSFIGIEIDPERSKQALEELDKYFVQVH